MYKRAPGPPTKGKKTIYLFAATILGLLLSVIGHAGIEMYYLRWAHNQNMTVPFYGGCALTPSVQMALWILGAAGGLWLGLVWWRIIYVDMIWEKRRRKK